MWRKIFVIFTKEARDNSRDRRSLLVALIYPLLGPLLLGLMISAIVDVTTVAKTGKASLALSGAEYAPELVRFLEDRDVRVVRAPKDVDGAVRGGDLETVVVIPKDFDAKFQAERTAQITVVSNSSRLPGLIALNRTATLLGDFNRQIWGQRIKDKGVDLDVLQPLAIKSHDVKAGTHIVEILLLMVPPLFIFNLFMGGVYLAMDTTSGERERGSLEPLLVNPVARWGIMLGKYLAALLYTAVGVLVQLTAFVVIFQTVGGDFAFAKIFSVTTVAGIFLVTLPLMMVAVGVQFIIATVTRSFKEAQTYLGLLPLVPAIPGMVMVFAPVQASEWMMTIPIFSQTLILSRMVQGDVLMLSDVLISMSTSVVAAALLIAFTAHLYGREKLIFGN
ncbi:MAG: ABC transporter permease [Alphaproteobacteria bacterium]|nr:ABC transporter permease [Alphaproteobacteria bacterium]